MFSVVPMEVISVHRENSFHCKDKAKYLAPNQTSPKLVGSNPAPSSHTNNYFAVKSSSFQFFFLLKKHLWKSKSAHGWWYLQMSAPTFAHLGIIMGQTHVHIHLIFVSFMLPGGLIKDQETCVEVGHRGPDPASALGECWEGNSTHPSCDSRQLHCNLFYLYE